MNYTSSSEDTEETRSLIMGNLSGNLYNGSSLVEVDPSNARPSVYPKALATGTATAFPT